MLTRKKWSGTIQNDGNSFYMFSPHCTLLHQIDVKEGDGNLLNLGKKGVWKKFKCLLTWFELLNQTKTVGESSNFGKG